MYSCSRFIHTFMLLRLVLCLCLVITSNSACAGPAAKWFFGLFSKSETSSVKTIAKESEKGTGHVAGDAVSVAAHSADSPYITAQLSRIAAKCIIYSSEAGEDEQKKELRCTAIQNQFLQCVSVKTKEGLAEEKASDFCANEDNAEKVAPKKVPTSWWMVITYFIILIVFILVLRFFIRMLWSGLVFVLKRVFVKSEKKD